MTKARLQGQGDSFYIRAVAETKTFVFMPNSFAGAKEKPKEKAKDKDEVPDLRLLDTAVLSLRRKRH